MTSNQGKSVSYSDRLRCRFILVYGSIGSISTFSLLIYSLINVSSTDISFFYASGAAFPLLTGTAYFAHKKKARIASILAIITMAMGCFGTLTLTFSAFLSLFMVFVLSALFITINRTQTLLVFPMLLFTAIGKILLELGVISVAIMPITGLEGEEIFYIGLFLLSIFSYALIVNYMLNQGLDSSEKLVETSKQLSETVRIKDRLVALISHDLRGPMSNMSLIIKGVKGGTLPMTSETLDMLNTASTNTSKLIDNLLLWSSARQDASMIKKETIKLRECVEETLEFLKIMFENKNVEILNECASDASAFADRSMTCTVIRNILSNAIKFSHDGKSIRIWTENNSNGQRVLIQDHGIGMSPGQVEKLFSNNHSSSLGTSNEKGSGLGLIISKDFIEFNSGKIGVESEEGNGSTFWFELPLT